jgi:hypothetical protein
MRKILKLPEHYENKKINNCRFVGSDPYLGFYAGMG